jgi:hypothetical protein
MMGSLHVRLLNNVIITMTGTAIQTYHICMQPMLHMGYKGQRQTD